MWNLHFDEFGKWKIKILIDKKQREPKQLVSLI